MKGVQNGKSICNIKKQCRVYEPELYNQTAWIWTPAFLFASSMTLDKLFNKSHLLNGIIVICDHKIVVRIELVYKELRAVCCI